jgi:hypothetical protein
VHTSTKKSALLPAGQVAEVILTIAETGGIPVGDKPESSGVRIPHEVEPVQVSMNENLAFPPCCQYRICPVAPIRNQRALGCSNQREEPRP